MILGMSLSAFTTVHTVLSLIGIFAGLVVLIALLAYYRYRVGGSWRWIYVVAALVALYFNVFVGVVQAFAKIPFPHSLAATQSDPPFVIAQLVVLVAFIVFGVIAIRSFHPRADGPVLRAA